MICAACTENVDPGNFCPECGQPPLLDGRYALRDVVGRGGMGKMYRANRESDGETVAVKELPVRQVETVKAMELFEREAATLEQLDHPGIPDYYEDFSAGEGRGLSVYLVQEYIAGQTLEAYVERNRPTEVDVIDMMIEVLAIFEYLHGLEPPVVHRDVKPSNIMRRSESGELVLVDFGSVRAAVDDSEAGGSTVAGTFGFMAPEQFRGRAQPASDIYGLAATAVAVLSRKQPRDLLNQRRELEWKSVVDLEPGFEAVLEEMLQVSPEERPSKAAALRKHLERVRAGEGAPGAVAPRSADTELPAPPREIPDGFLKQYGAGAYYWLSGGGLFVVGGLVIGAVIGMFASVVIGGLLGLMFLVPAYKVVSHGLERRDALHEMYRTGRATVGTVELPERGHAQDIAKGFDNEDGDEQPDLSKLAAMTGLSYEFEVGSETYSGKLGMFESSMLLKNVASTYEAPVVYAPDDPSRHEMLVAYKN